MPKIGDMFPSKYLKAADLEELQKRGRLPVNLRISRIVSEDVSGGEGREKQIKPVMYFQGKDKGLVINRTNGDEAALLLGSDDTDDWPDRVIGLTVQRVRFKNETVPALRIVAPRGEQQQQTQPRASDHRAAAAAPPRQTRRADPEPEPDPDPFDSGGGFDEGSRFDDDDEIPF